MLKKQEQKPEGRPEKDERKARLYGLKKISRDLPKSRHTNMYFKNKFEQHALTLYHDPSIQ